VDLDTLRSKMAATIERAKAEDPRELRRQIAELRKELAQRVRGVVLTAKVPAPRAAPLLKEGQLKRLETMYARMLREAERHGKAMSLLWGHQAEEAKALLAVLRSLVDQSRIPAPPIPSRERPAVPVRETPRLRIAEQSAPSDGLTGPEQRILDAIVWCESIGIGNPNQTAVAFLAGYTFGAGAFNNPRGKLRAAGHVQYLGSDRICLTQSGRSLATMPMTPLTIDELHQRVLDRLPTPAQRILRPLLEAYPKALTKDEVAERAGYTPGAGAFNNPMGRLRSLGLIEYPSGGQAIASPVLFLEPGS